MSEKPTPQAKELRALSAAVRGLRADGVILYKTLGAVGNEYDRQAEALHRVEAAQHALLGAVRGLTDAQRVNTEKLNKIAAFLAQLEAMGR